MDVSKQRRKAILGGGQGVVIAIGSGSTLLVAPCVLGFADKVLALVAYDEVAPSHHDLFEVHAGLDGEFVGLVAKDVSHATNVELLLEHLAEADVCAIDIDVDDLVAIEDANVGGLVLPYPILHEVGGSL